MSILIIVEKLTRFFAPKRRPSLFNLKSITTLFILCGFSFSTYSHVDLPNLGDPASLILSSKEERELAQSILSQLKHSLKISQDTVINDYVRSVGYRLIASHAGTNSNYLFFVVEDSSINAFALPGSMIGVNTGLIITAQTESELAGVLAHEIAHVELHHIAKSLQHMSKVRIANAAGLIAGMIIASQDSEAGTGIMAAALASGTQSILNFTRENEKEADFVGIHSLAAAGFEPLGMMHFFQRMAQATRYYGSTIPEFLRTHPLTESRIVAARSRAEMYPFKQIPDSLLFHLVQARLKVNAFNTASDASAHYAALLKKGTYSNKIATEYGYALALFKEGKVNRAHKILSDLITKKPNQPLFHLALAQVEIKQNHLLKAITRLKKALDNHPNNHPLTLEYTQALIQANQTQNAILVLNKHSHIRRGDPEIYRLLTKAYSQINEKIQAHRMEAEYRLFSGDFKGALSHLKLAMKEKDVPPKIQKQIISRQTEIERFLWIQRGK